MSKYEIIPIMTKYNIIPIRNDIYTIEKLLTKYRNNDIITDLDKDAKWTDDKCDLLIESILLGISIGSFYCSELINPFPDKQYVQKVIDGTERLGCINAFNLNMFQLDGLEILSEFNGMRFRELPIQFQNRFLDAEIQIKIFDFRTDKKLIDNIIQRINN